MTDESVLILIIMAALRRTIKNFVFNFTESQKKVREATSNDPWAPATELLTQIAEYSFSPAELREMMQIIWKRLNDAGHNWRHVYKSLVLLEYLLLKGSERVAQHCRENIYSIQVLKDFRYNEDGKDHGLRIREKSKIIFSLLKDADLLKQERTKVRQMRDRDVIEQTRQPFKPDSSEVC